MRFTEEQLEPFLRNRYTRGGGRGGGGGGGGGGISGMNLVQVCRWTSLYPPYKCILEYGKNIPINDVLTIMKNNKKCSLFH